jgi:hypothetical protein
MKRLDHARGEHTPRAQLPATGLFETPLGLLEVSL